MDPVKAHPCDARGQVAPDAGNVRLETDLGAVEPERWMTSVSLAAPWMALPST